MFDYEMNKQTAKILFDTLQQAYLEFLYDLKVEKIRMDELDCFCYSVIIAYIYKYQSSEQAKKTVGYFTEIIWEKYQPNFATKLKQRYNIYQKYLGLYFSNQKTTTGLDTAMVMGFILINFVVEKMKINHIYVVELSTTIHKMIFISRNKIRTNTVFEQDHLSIQMIESK